MKTNLLRISLVALAAAAAAYAQSSLPLKADVPFDFIVGSQTLPAGQYTVNPTSTAIMIRCDNQKGAAIALSNEAVTSKGAQHAKLVFTRYGETYFLSQVWPEGSANGRELPRSKREREMLAQRSTEPDKVILASR